MLTRLNLRKLTDDGVAVAAQRYDEEGLSISQDTSLGATAETLRQEFVGSGVARRSYGRFSSR